MKLSEPVTAITDFLLMIECFLFAFLLIRGSSEQLSIQLWGMAFVALAAGSLSGGIFHGLRHSLGERALLHLWRITAFSLIAGFIFFAAGGMYSVSAGVLRKAVLGVAGLLLAVVAALVGRRTMADAGSYSFFPYLLAVLLVLGLFLGRQLLSGALDGTHTLAGSWICVLGMAVQQKRFQLGRHFNQNDLCHILFFAGLYFLYSGGTYLQD